MTSVGAPTATPRLILSLAVALLCATSLGCGEPVTPATTIMRVLEERRAQAIIERALFDTGMKPLPGREFALQNGQLLREDFAIGQTNYGIAYVTQTESQTLAAGLPKRENTQQLHMFRPDQEAIVLLLYQNDYKFDVGSKHRATAVTAEAKLSRDVSDFIIHVVKMDAAR